ncbi:MAG: hypothetical protein E7773_06985 [Sphingomonas sp.]|uniref:hypothetical protein n=1 Tax=Sphingomonas sp. TaxID=28214 RepID=UPI0012185A2D|nr:hypothetical protein [Sphingomonas sp.]THD36737.1 MAG: hypothetical protein E7773_06985 [Sphingomonas sp.]
MKKAVALAIVLAVAPVVAAPAMAKDKVPELSTAQMNEIQGRTYSASAAQVMASAVAALQSAGYMEITANKDAGTVSGHTDGKSKLMYNFFWGFGKKKMTQTAEFLVEELTPGHTTLRLNIFLNESKTRSIIFGNRMTDASLIKVAEPYQTLLDSVSAEVGKRGGTMTPAVAATAVAPAVAEPAAAK